MKNIEIKDLEEMEEVSEIAVNRCRKRIVNLQTKVERRKDMLEKVRDKLCNFEEDTINEDCENIMRILEMRKSEMGIQLSSFKTYQRTMDLKRLGLLNSLKGHSSRILNVDKKRRKEELLKWNMKSTKLSNTKNQSETEEAKCFCRMGKFNKTEDPSPSSFTQNPCLHHCYRVIH